MNFRQHVFGLLLITFIGVPVAFSHADYQASDLLGQVDSDGVTVNYTLSNRNNIPLTNNHGLLAPAGVMVDSAEHRLFVADSNNNRVLVFNLNSDDTLVDLNADFVLGQSDFSSMSAQTNQAGMNAPSAVHYDANSKKLFVSDTNNNRVLVFDLTSGITNGMNATYELGQPSGGTAFTSSDPLTQQGRLYNPRGLAYATSTSQLFVADSNNNRVLIYNLGGGITNGMNASFQLGQTSFTNASPSVSQSRMEAPYGVAIDPFRGLLFVADYNNNRVLIYSIAAGITNGMNATYELGQPSGGSAFTSKTSATTQSRMYQPIGVASDYVNNRLFVSENSNSRVLVFDFSSGITNGMSATYELGQIAGGSAFTTNTQVNPPTQVSIITPYQISYSTSTNRLFVATPNDNRVLSFNLGSGITNGMNASEVIGQTAGTVGRFDSSFQNDRNANPLGFNYPFGLVLDTVDHRLFISDCSSNRVVVHNLDSNNNVIDRSADYVLGQSTLYGQTATTTRTGLRCPAGLAYSTTTKTLFVADNSNNRVLVFDLTSGITNGMNATYELGQPSGATAFTTSGSSLSQQGMSGPCAIVVDDNLHLLFVSDYQNHRVLVFDTSSGISNGMNATYELGQPAGGSAFTSGTSGTSQSAFNGPYALSYAPLQKLLFVDDESNHRVMIFDFSAGITNGMNASYVIGQPTFDAVDWTTASSTSTKFPEELAYDSDNRHLYVADEGNNRLLMFDLSSGIQNGMAASAVVGTSDFDTAGSGNASRTELNDPELGMSYDLANNRIWMVDSSNNRAISFEFIRITTSSLSDGVTNTSYSGNVAVTGSQGTVSYSVSSGLLPNGLSLNSSTGAITGTPTRAGLYSFTIKATDNVGTQGQFSDSATYSMTITVGNTISSSSGSSVSSGGSSGGSSGFVAPSSVLTNNLAPSAQVIGCPKGFICQPIPGYVAPQKVLLVGSEAPVPSLKRDLQFGMKNDDIKILQQYLNQKGFMVSSVVGSAGSIGFETNFFGPATKAALIRFQKANKLPPTGYFGSLTRALINK